jgi:hypothetical protein
MWGQSMCCAPVRNRSIWVRASTLHLGFPLFVKKLFTRNIVTDVTDGYYVVITVLRRNKNMQNYITKLRYEITLQNYVTKLLRETKNNRNYVTLWRIRNQEVKIGVYFVENSL